jgi:tRNA U34 5-carboxymethylaminomethyl modifying GTPase MnmE/TrmE
VIDKKPFRVTNEQARSAIKADHITGNTTAIIKDYARELLEARVLLKKAIDFLEYCNEDAVNEFLEKTKDYAE